jgi:hypothetical protein
MSCMKTLAAAALAVLTLIPSFAQQPAPTPVLYSNQTMAELEKLQRAALDSNYAYRRVAHLTNNIGPRLSDLPRRSRRWNMALTRCERQGSMCGCKR